MVYAMLFGLRTAIRRARRTWTFFVAATLSGAVRRRADRHTYQLDFPAALRHLSAIAVVAVLVIHAAAELGISATLLIVLTGVLLAAVSGTLTRAFGLGSRELARALSAARHLRRDDQVGQQIAFGNVPGCIARSHLTSTMLDGGSGGSIRVLNHLLMDNIVTI